MASNKNACHPGGPLPCQAITLQLLDHGEIQGLLDGSKVARVVVQGAKGRKKSVTVF